MHAASFRSVCVYTHKTTDAGRHPQAATSYFGCDKVQTTWTPTVQLVVWTCMAAKKSINTWSLFINIFCVYCKFCGFCSFSLFSLWTSTFQRYGRQSPKFNNKFFILREGSGFVVWLIFLLYTQRDHWNCTGCEFSCLFRHAFSSLPRSALLFLSYTSNPDNSCPSGLNEKRRVNIEFKVNRL